MPTIDEMFPIRLSERPLRFSDAPPDAAKILHGELSRTARQTDELLTGIAIHWFHLDRLARETSKAGSADSSVSEGLTILAANLKDVLDAHAIEARDLTGAAFDSQMQSQVDVRGHSTNDGLDGPTVVHTELPPVLRHGRLLAKGAVLVETPRRE